MGAPHRTEILVGVGCVVLTANKVLQLIEMTTACQDACQLYREHHFLDESVKAGSGYPFCGNSFIRRRRLDDFSSRNVFIRTLFYLEIFLL